MCCLYMVLGGLGMKIDPIKVNPSTLEYLYFLYMAVIAENVWVGKKKRLFNCSELVFLHWGLVCWICNWPTINVHWKQFAFCFWLMDLDPATYNTTVYPTTVLDPNFIRTILKLQNNKK